MMSVAAWPSNMIEPTGTPPFAGGGALIDGPGSSPLVSTTERGRTRPDRGTSSRSTAIAWPSTQTLLSPLTSTWPLPLWGQYAFLHKLIESRLHCFFDLVPHPVRVRVELGLHGLPLFLVRQHVPQVRPATRLRPLLRDR
jgi:hypothetical protein